MSIYRQLYKCILAGKALACSYSANSLFNFHLKHCYWNEVINLHWLGMKRGKKRRRLTKLKREKKKRENESIHNRWMENTPHKKKVVGGWEKIRRIKCSGWKLVTGNKGNFKKQELDFGGTRRTEREEWRLTEILWCWRRVTGIRRLRGKRGGLRNEEN